MFSRMKSTEINSDVMAMYISETLVCSIISTVIDIPYISVFLMITLMIIVFLANQGRVFNSIKKKILKASVISTVLLLSSYLNGIEYVKNYALHFICFGVAAMYLSSVKIDVSRVIRTLLLVYAIYLVTYFFAIRDNFKMDSNYWNIQMGVAYGFVPIILLSVLIYLYPDFYKKRKRPPLISYIVGILAMLFLLFDTGTRGAIVTVIIGVMCLILTKLNSWKRIMMTIVFSTIMIIAIYFYREIILIVYNGLVAFDIKIGAIDKMVFMINQGTESNGRDVLISAAKTYFFNSPFIGNGIGFFEKQQGMYVHNIFWQLLCEYGIVGFLFALVLISKKTKLILRSRDEVSYFLMFIFCIAVPMLLYSNTYWLIPYFWLFFFWDVNKNLIFKERSC